MFKSKLYIKLKNIVYKNKFKVIKLKKFYILINYYKYNSK